MTTIDISKQFGFEQGKRAGIDAAVKTFTQTAPGNLAAVISNDLTVMLNRAVNSAQKPDGVASILHLSELVGYLESLARVTVALAEGASFVVEQDPGADPRLTIKKAK